MIKSFEDLTVYACADCGGLACLTDDGCLQRFPSGTAGQTLVVGADGCPNWETKNTDLGIAGTTITYTRYDGTTRTFDTCVDIVAKCSVDALTDVDTTTTPPVAGQVLTWNGTNWVPAAAAVPFTCTDLNACSVNALADVAAETATSGDTLLFNGTNWVNVSPCSVLTSCEIGDLGNVNTDILNPGDVLTFVAGEWVPQAPASAAFVCTNLNTCSLNDLGDVVLTAPAIGESLIFNGTEWVNDFQCPVTVTFADNLFNNANPYGIDFFPGLCNLNIPRPSVALLANAGGGVALPNGGGITDVGSLLSNTVTDTAGMADPGAGDIIIPVDGIYDLVGSVGVGGGILCPGGTLFMSFAINGAYAGRYSAVGTTQSLANQASGSLPNFQLNAGDVISLGAGVVDCPGGGVSAASAYLGVSLVQQT